MQTTTRRVRGKLACPCLAERRQARFVETFFGVDSILIIFYDLSKQCLCLCLLDINEFKVIADTDASTRNFRDCESPDCP